MLPVTITGLVVLADIKEAASDIARTYILIPILFLSFWALVAVLAIIVAILRAHARQARAEYEQQQEKTAGLRPDGIPYPPSARGLCDNCQKVFEKIYFIPNGRSLCPSCYHRMEKLNELSGKETP